MKMGLSNLIDLDNLTEPVDKKYKCAVVEWTSTSTASLIDSATQEDCQIKQQAQGSGTVNVIKYNTLVIPMGEVAQQLVDAANFPVLFPAPKEAELLMKDGLDATASVTPKVHFFLRMQKEQDEQLEKVQAQKATDDHIAYLNALIANDITYQDNWNIIPPLKPAEVEVDQIEDLTRSFAMEEDLRAYLGASYLKVGNSRDQTFDLSAPGTIINQFMFFNNESQAFKMLFQGRYITFKDLQGQVSIYLDTKKIQKCTVIHNVVPFSINPRDKTWCGVAFPQGAQDSIVQLNMKFIQIKAATNTECIQKARSLQRSLQDSCSEGDQLMRTKIFQPQKILASSVNSVGGVGNEGVERMPEDGAGVAMRQSIPQYDPAHAKANAQQLGLKKEVDTFTLKPIDFNDPKHGPSRDDDRVRLDKVIQPLLPRLEELEPSVYFLQDVTKQNLLNTRYNPSVFSEDRKLALFKQFLSKYDNESTTRFQQNVNIQTESDKTVQLSKPDPILDPEGQQEYLKQQNTILKNQISRKADKAFDRDENKETIQQWSSELLKNGINEVNGRGQDLNNVNLLQDTLQAKIKNTDPADANPNSEPQPISQMWYDLILDTKKHITTKKQKTDGVLNGDELVQRNGCCSQFTSKAYKTDVRTCYASMAFSSGSELKFQNVLGQEITREQFEEDERKCLGEAEAEVPKMVEPTGAPGEIPVVQADGTLILNEVTTIKDGKLIRDDGTIQVTENLATTGTLVSKPGEEVQLTPDLATNSVREAVVDSAGAVRNTLVVPPLLLNPAPSPAPDATLLAANGNPPTQSVSGLGGQPQGTGSGAQAGAQGVGPSAALAQQGINGGSHEAAGAAPSNPTQPGGVSGATQPSGQSTAGSSVDRTPGTDSAGDGPRGVGTPVQSVAGQGSPASGPAGQRPSGAGTTALPPSLNQNATPPVQLTGETITNSPNGAQAPAPIGSLGQGPNPVNVINDPNHNPASAYGLNTPAINGVNGSVVNNGAAGSQNPNGPNNANDVNVSTNPVNPNGSAAQVQGPIAPTPFNNNDLNPNNPNTLHSNNPNVINSSNPNSVNDQKVNGQGLNPSGNGNGVENSNGNPNSPLNSNNNLHASNTDTLNGPIPTNPNHIPIKNPSPNPNGPNGPNGPNRPNGPNGPTESPNGMGTLPNSSNSLNGPNKPGSINATNSQGQGNSGQANPGGDGGNEQPRRADERSNGSTLGMEEGVDRVPAGTIKRDIGQQDIWIDKENKVTIHAKDGADKTKVEKVVDAQRSGDTVFIHFQDGSQLKHFLITGETVKVYHEQERVAHFQPDQSVLVDDKKAQLRSIHNQQGATATFDLAKNKFLDQQVKRHFRYGSDLVQVLRDDTVIMNKQSGQSVVLNPDKAVDVINKQGQIQSKTDYRFRLRYNLQNTQLQQPQVKTFDKINNEQFEKFKDSIMTRGNEGNRLYEVLPSKIKLEIKFFKKGFQKTREVNGTEERCYRNMMGAKIDEASNVFQMCKCDDKQVLDLWSCHKSNDKFTMISQIIKDLKQNNLMQDQVEINNQDDLDYEFLRKLTRNN